MSSQRSAILLLAHGTPDKLSEMAAYLDKVTGGRPMSPEVVAELQHRYAEIGLREEPLPEGPPLTRWTLKQAALLQQLTGERVYVGMRNWHPFIADTVAQMKADGVTHARVLCLAPQNSRTSTGLYRKALEAAVDGAFDVDFIAGWADEPLLARAFAERLWPVWAEACAALASPGQAARVPVLFTAHAVPCRTIMTPTSTVSSRPEAAPLAAGVKRPAATGNREPVPADGIQNYGDALPPDPYPVECKQTAMRIAAALRPVGMTDADWYFAFQSQGIAGAPWLGPTVPDTLQALAAAGHKGVILQPVGFLCDHVEILYDIDIDFKQQAEALGMQLWRAESLNDSPTLIHAIADALQRPAVRLNPHEIPAAPTRPAGPRTAEPVSAR